ncbi:perlucin-like protein [Mya arenaria]|uniref:perlucin-like protein n=1 Tax=Mya arenaria TaxID=6604 RepID=UPI0022E8EA71|nr:perlucin-like protein [Mya arenaria]
MMTCVSLTMLQLLFASAVFTVAVGQCPSGWEHHDESCYFLHWHDKYDWIESTAFCSTHPHAYLADVTDNSENAFIKGLIVNRFANERDAHVWLGATDEITEGVFVWNVNNQKVIYTDWGPGEPNSVPLNIREDCLVYWAHYSWKWADLDCHQKCYFVCEMPMDDSIIVGK